MADTNMITSYQEAANQLFEAMDLITSKRVNALGFDKTLICTIESVENSKNGMYRVTDGVSHFNAYSDTDTIYTKGLKVYVKVPNGDMNNQKIITGKYVSTENQYVSYVSPLNSFVDITSNIITDRLQFSLKANDERKMITVWEYQPDLVYSEELRRARKIEIDKDTTSLKEKRIENYNSYQTPRILLDNISSNNDLTPMEKTILSQDIIAMTVPSGFKGYDRLGISGDFKTLLDYRTKDGSYGLRLDILGVNQNGLQEIKRYYLDSSDMYGNPYQYSTFYKQEYLYDISNLQEVLNIRLMFYQNSDFILEDGTPINPADTKGRDDIILQAPYIAFGYDLNNFTEDKVLIGTHDSLMYSNNIIPKERKVYMRWAHKIEDKFYALDESTETPENAIIHWYRYRLEENRNDELAGPFWKEFNPGEDKYNHKFEPDTTTDTDAFKVIIEIPSREIVTQDLGANINLLQTWAKLLEKTGPQQGLSDGISSMIETTDLNFVEETYDLLKAQYITNDEQAQLFSEIHNIITEERARTQYYSSDILTFTNAIPQTLEAIDLIQSLTITADEGNYEGVYRLYDETYHIINSTEASKQRILKANYSSVVTGITELDSAEEITWYFPKEQSMIQLPVEGKEYSIENGDEYIENCGRRGYVAIRRTGTDTVEQLEPGLSLIETTQTFRIKEHYTQSASTNIIYCTVKKRDKLYEASVVLYFGTTGSNGTEATFLLKMYDENGVDEVSALTIGKKVIIKPELYDFNNQSLYINSINYIWKEKNSSDVIQMVKSGNELSLTIEEETDIYDCQFYILQASTPYTIITDINENGEEKKREVSLTAFLPIPVRISDEFVEIEGATKIVYDSNGSNPRYYKNPYKLYGAQLELFNTVEWEVYSADFDRIEDDKGNALTSAKRYYPVIQPTGEFMPTKMYYTGLSSVSVNAYLEGDMVWTQPLLIIQNKYASAMLNDWDGNLTIDEKNGTILSAMMGAGIKNEDNSFSGIVMGDMGKVSDNFDPNNKTGIGLYGLDHGAQSYGFNVDGTAFIGKSGKGRINFNGINGTITSGNYEEDVAGMQIDLDDPFLKAYGVAGSAVLNLSKEDKDLFTISGIVEYNAENKPVYKPLLNVGAGDYFLQSIDFSSIKGEEKGVKFDLTNGELKGYNFELYTANRIADNLYSSVRLTSSGNPYFQIHYASEKKYENVPVFKIYEPRTYYYFDSDEVFRLDESLTYTQDRVYYNSDKRALNIVNPNIVYGRKSNTFYLYAEIGEGEENPANYFELVTEYVSGIQYYSAQNESSKITVVNDAYAYEPNKYYTMSEDNYYILDSNEYYTPGRIYYDDYHNQLNNILDNRIYKYFSLEKEAGNLYVAIDGTYKIDTSTSYTPNRIYYKDNAGEVQVKVVSNTYEIFKENTYYQRMVQGGVTTYVIQNNYYSNMQYYKDVVTDEFGNQTATAVAMASPDSVYYEPNKYYYFVESNWRKVEENESFTQDASYAILEDGNYNNEYFIIESGLIYMPNTYFYIAEGSVIEYKISTSYQNNVQYYIDINGTKTPVKVIQETDTLKIFRTNTYYRYYKFNGVYREADGDYNPYNTYYTLVTRDGVEVYESIELINGAYEFEPDKFYVYNEINDGYILASQFSDVQYYILTDEVQQNDLVKITKNKFELKSHDWNISNRIGMHFDITSSGGYIEGYSEYTNSNGELVKPKFILDWRKNRDPINVNDGVFKVKWNGETICTNIKATGGKIGGWKIDNNQIIGNNIILYCSSELSAIYAGPKAKNFIDFIVEKQTVNTSQAAVSDTLEFTEVDWNTLGISDDNKYFYVNDEGVLEAYMAQIQYLKAKTLYVENMYLGKRQVQWKSKKVVIATNSSRRSVVTGGSMSRYQGSHRHGYTEGNPYTKVEKVSHVHTLSFNHTTVVGSSSDTKDQIVYLG